MSIREVMDFENYNNIFRKGGMVDKKAKPTVICLCGSTRFAELHAIIKWNLEKEGNVICLMISYLPEWFAKKEGWKGYHHFGEQAGKKEKLDELHLRKIDLADEIFVVNRNRYIGESTREEIEYAKKQGKKIRYLEEQKSEEARCQRDQD